jgi:hypothetical protein
MLLQIVVDQRFRLIQFRSVCGILPLCKRCMAIRMHNVFQVWMFNQEQYNALCLDTSIV